MCLARGAALEHTVPPESGESQHQLVGISSLDTSGLGGLRHLEVSWTNLTSLDTRPLTSLKKIYLNGTQIKALNTMPMRGLEGLSIPDARIKFLSTTGLESLKYLDSESTRIGNIHIIAGWKIGNLDIRGTGIRFVDGRNTMQVDYFNVHDGQTALHDELVDESFKDEDE